MILLTETSALLLLIIGFPWCAIGQHWYDEESLSLEANTTSTTSTTTKRTKVPWDRFALFYCEKLKECNIIPKEVACGVEIYTHAALWFENKCTMYKANCLQMAAFMETASARCNASGPVITNRVIDTNWFQPLGYHPYYTHDKHIH